MTTVAKIENDITRTKERIAELQKRLRALEARKIEAENLEIVNLVKAVKMDNATLTIFLKAYAKGDVKLPNEYIAELEYEKEPNAETGEGVDEE